MPQIIFEPAHTPAPRLIRRVALFFMAALLVAVGFGSGAASAGAASNLTIYSNSLRGADGRKQVRQYGRKATCKRGGSPKAFRLKVGKATRECFYQPPVVGRDLQMTTAARLFKKTPRGVLKRAWVAVNLRQAANGSRYQFAVIPRLRRYSLRRIAPNGKMKILAYGKDTKKINPPNKANRITFRAYNGVKGQPASSARLVGVVNGKRLALVDDKQGDRMKGRDVTFSIGSKRSTRGGLGSFVNLKIAMPDPF